jgi:cysteinyl-tRNA synthetase
MKEGEVNFLLLRAHCLELRTHRKLPFAVAADILRRYLKFKGFKVTHVMNITDVEDRIIAKSQEAGCSIDEYTAQYIDALWEDFDALGCERLMSCRVQRVTFRRWFAIEKLLATDHAYRSDDSIYYRISSFPEYGKLSKINFAGNIAGASERVDTDKYEKEDARDFALWKEPESETEPAWDRVNRARSTGLAHRVLRDVDEVPRRDIRHPRRRHRSRLSTSRERDCAERRRNRKQFVRYWIHFEHLKVEGETMSKSKGNYYTFRDCTAKGFSPAAIRYFLLSVPYNKQLNFTFDALAGARKTVASLRDFRARLSEAKIEPGHNELARSRCRARKSLKKDGRRSEHVIALAQFTIFARK